MDAESTMSARHPNLILAEMTAAEEAGTLTAERVVALSGEITTYWMERARCAEADADRLWALLNDPAFSEYTDDGRALFMAAADAHVEAVAQR